MNLQLYEIKLICSLCYIKFFTAKFFFDFLYMDFLRHYTLIDSEDAILQNQKTELQFLRF